MNVPEDSPSEFGRINAWTFS